MDMRQYDPAIARWTSIDPVIHHSMSTYTAFDNNPVYWADPSGADSVYNWDTGKYVINGKEVSQDEAVAYVKNGGNADGSNNNEVDDHITNPHKNELEIIANDLNRIYQNKYGESPFSVKAVKKREKIFKIDKRSGEESWEEIEYISHYILEGSVSFNWERDKYAKALYDIMTSEEDILVDIIQDKGKIYRKMKFSSGRGHLSDFGGGSTDSKNRISLSNALSIYSSSNSSKWTIGGVTLHELLFHISPNKNLNEGANIMRRFYNIKTGRDHGRGKRINKNI
jgi:hypothetical protein